MGKKARSPKKKIFKKRPKSDLFEICFNQNGDFFNQSKVKSSNNLEKIPKNRQLQKCFYPLY